jgi:hypothetical protein
MTGMLSRRIQPLGFSGRLATATATAGSAGRGRGEEEEAYFDDEQISQPQDGEWSALGGFANIGDGG